jgi:hypothetical protein
MKVEDVAGNSFVDLHLPIMKKIYIESVKLEFSFL